MFDRLEQRVLRQDPHDEILAEHGRLRLHTNEILPPSDPHLELTAGRPTVFRDVDSGAYLCDL